MSQFRKSGEKTVTVGFRLDMVFHQLRIGLFHMDHDLIKRNLEKAQRLVFLEYIALPKEPELERFFLCHQRSWKTYRDRSCDRRRSRRLRRHRRRRRPIFRLK